MIAVVATPGPLRDAVLSRLPADTRAVVPGDPMTLARALEGVERMFLAVDDAVLAGDAVAAAEMAHVYLCVSLGPVDALVGSALRSTVLLDDPSAPFDVEATAALAASELTSD